jgi:hypothetical protein
VDPRVGLDYVEKRNLNGKERLKISGRFELVACPVSPAFDWKD